MLDKIYYSLTDVKLTGEQRGLWDDFNESLEDYAQKDKDDCDRSTGVNEAVSPLLCDSFKRGFSMGVRIMA